MDELAGYRGKALELLRKSGAKVGDVVELATDWGSVTGTLVPRYLYNDESHVVLKLGSGYNVGLSIKKLKEVKLVRKGEAPKFAPGPPPKPGKGLPRVLIISTGGTIASRVDYRTGAVHPVVSSAELHSLIPELSGLADIETEVMFSVYSENIEPANWSRLAVRVGRAVKQGFDGVVITHGTDTLGYTSAALSFALRGVPIPVVMVAAQRSSDRPSSDATLNLIGGVSVAASAGFSGVYVAMHLNTTDDKVAVHSGTRVRKNHTSSRAAFQSVGVPLAAVWGKGGIEYVDSSLPARGKAAGFTPKPRFQPRVALVKFYPSMPPGVMRAVSSGMRAVVVEGTGLGHVNSRGVTVLKRYVSRGKLAFMTSQCINGRVDLNVYDTGRDLLRAGVVPLGDMLSETALVKAMWVTGNTRSSAKATEMMTQNLAGELTERGFLE